MRIAICEDEDRHMEELIKIIDAWRKSRDCAVDVVAFQSGEAFLAEWSDKCEFDVIFLDIQMGILSGMEIAEIIRRTDETMSIIFLTGLKDFILRGYEVRALRYLLKPVRRAECFTTLDKAKSIYDNIKRDVFIIPVETQSIRLLFNDIYYFESQGHIIEVHSDRGIYRYREKISRIEQSLPYPQFFRCHRSCLVNMHHVHLINSGQLQLDSGEILPVSQNRWRTLNHAFLVYHGKGQ